MLNIQRFQFNTKDITCYVVNGDPYFKGNDVASILGYACPGKALIDHVPDRFNQSYESLIGLSSNEGMGKPPLVNNNEVIAIYISEAGMYKLIFRTKNHTAVDFTDCVCEAVLP